MSFLINITFELPQVISAVISSVNHPLGNNVARQYSIPVPKIEP